MYIYIYMHVYIYTLTHIYPKPYMPKMAHQSFSVESPMLSEDSAGSATKGTTTTSRHGRLSRGQKAAKCVSIYTSCQLQK